MAVEADEGACTGLVSAWITLPESESSESKSTPQGQAKQAEEAV